MVLPIYILTALSPLIVGGVCTLLYRRMGGDHLLFWALAHVALAFGFFVNAAHLSSFARRGRASAGPTRAPL